MLVALPVGPGIAVAGNGVRMPPTQLASVEVPVILEQPPVERPIIEREVPKAPVVPVYRRKQARY